MPDQWLQNLPDSFEIAVQGPGSLSNAHYREKPTVSRQSNQVFYTYIIGY
jgi:hypothetical protein